MSRDVRAILTANGCVLEPPKGCLPRVHFVDDMNMHFYGYCTVVPLLSDEDLLRSLVGQIMAGFAHKYRVCNPLQAVVGLNAEQPTANLAAEELQRCMAQYHAADSKVISVGADEVRDTYGELAGYALPPESGVLAGKLVVVMVGVLRHAYDAERLLTTIREAGGIPVGVGGLMVNSHVPCRLDLPVIAGCSYRHTMLTERECQQDGPCSSGVPIATDAHLGDGAAYQRRHPELPASMFVELTATRQPS